MSEQIAIIVNYPQTRDALTAVRDDAARAEQPVRPIVELIDDLDAGAGENSHTYPRPTDDFTTLNTTADTLCSGVLAALHARTGRTYPRLDAFAQIAERRIGPLDLRAEIERLTRQSAPMPLTELATTLNEMLDAGLDPQPALTAGAVAALTGRNQTPRPTGHSAELPILELWADGAEDRRPKPRTKVTRVASEQHFVLFRQTSDNTTRYHYEPARAYAAAIVQTLADAMDPKIHSADNFAYAISQLAHSLVTAARAARDN